MMNPAAPQSAWRNAVRVARRSARLLISSDARWDSFSEWGRRFRGEPPLPDGEIRSVLVICYGNICRSAVAAPLLARLRPDLSVRGAGFAAREGKPAEPGTLRAALKLDLDLAGHGAHRLDPEDVAWADLILGMEGHQEGFIARQWPSARARTRVLGHYLPEPPYAIADPWGHSDAVFEHTFERIRLSIERLAAQLPRISA